MCRVKIISSCWYDFRALFSIPSSHVWIPLGVWIQVKERRQVSCKKGNSQSVSLAVASGIKKINKTYMCTVKRISFVYSCFIDKKKLKLLLYNPILSHHFKEQHYPVIQTVVKHWLTCCTWSDGKPVEFLHSSWLKGSNGRTLGWCPLGHVKTTTTVMFFQLEMG